MRGDKPLFSRSGVTSPLGKLTEQIPAVRIAGETKEVLEVEARKAGLTLQEFVREVLVIRAHGINAVRRMYEERCRVVSGSSVLSSDKD